METAYSMKPIAHIQTPFATKFGVPRQSGLADDLLCRIVFEPAYRNKDALRGLEDFSHLWLVWVFDQAIRKDWSPTVRPPRLGGNTRMGVFATRSPFRPNPIALSCVRIGNIDWDDELGPVIEVYGADLMDGTPILDIKPYLPYADCKPEAVGGFASAPAGETLTVTFSPAAEASLPAELKESLRSVLAQDPRPHYQNDPQRTYGFVFAGFEVKFQVDGSSLKVMQIDPAD